MKRMTNRYTKNIKWVFKNSCKKHLNLNIENEALDLSAQALRKMYASKELNKITYLGKQDLIGALQ